MDYYPARRGYCGETTWGPSDCIYGFKGTWNEPSIQACKQRCTTSCVRCRYVSYSQADHECGWFNGCAMKALSSTFSSAFRTVQVRSSRNPTIEELQRLTPWQRQGGPGALHAFARLLGTESEQPLHIAVYGTSISDESQERVSNESYPHLLETQLRKHFPLAKVRVSVRAYPGATIDFMRHCVDSMLPEAADLYIIEHSTIDAVGPDWSSQEHDLHEMLSAIERRGGCPPFILVSAFDQYQCVRRIKRMIPFEQLPSDAETSRRSVRACLEGDGTPIDQEPGAPNLLRTSAVERVAASRSLAWVSVRKLLWTQLNHTADPLEFMERYTLDYLHLTPLAHALVARQLERLLIKASKASAATLAAPPCPTPLGHSTTATPARCAFGARMHPFVLSRSGWEYVIEQNARKRPKPGYIANSAGATLDVCFLIPPESSQSFWGFAYLISGRQKMGRVQVECVEGCSCTSKEFNGQAAGHLDVTALV